MLKGVILLPLWIDFYLIAADSFGLMRPSGDGRCLWFAMGGYVLLGMGVNLVFIGRSWEIRRPEAPCKAFILIG